MSILYKKKLKVMSYNIWFSEYERDNRLKSLIHIINNENPDVVCLQEVLRGEYEKLKIALKYDNYFPDEIKEGTYGCVIFSKHKIIKSLSIKLPSNMSRNLMISQINVEFDCDGNKEYERIVIANTHFESEFSRDGNDMKMQQYTYVAAILNKLYLDYDSVILCADTNVIEPEYKTFDKIFIKMNDSWKDNGSKLEDEYTYDNLTNKNLKNRNIVLRSRIDRILYRCNGSMHTDNFKLLTGEKDMIQPSDHHGIFAVFNVMHAHFKV